MCPAGGPGDFGPGDDQGVYLATGRAATTGRVLRIPAEVLRDRLSAWFPLGGHLIEGLYRTARSIEATARRRSDGRQRWAPVLHPPRAAPCPHPPPRHHPCNPPT